MGYCCHVQDGAPSCYLELLNKLQKQICRIVGLPLVVFLEPLSHHQIVGSLSLFYRNCFGRCLSKVTQQVSLPYSRGKSTHYSDRLHDFSVTIPKMLQGCLCQQFLSSHRLWNSLPKKCFPLTFDLNSFENQQTLFNCRFFLNRFPVCFNFFVLLVLKTQCHKMSVQPCME